MASSVSLNVDTCTFVLYFSSNDLIASGAM